MLPQGWNWAQEKRLLINVNRICKQNDVLLYRFIGFFLSDCSPNMNIIHEPESDACG